MRTLFLNRITDKLDGYAPYRELMQRIERDSFPIRIDGPRGVFLALLLSRIAAAREHPTLIVVPTEREMTVLQNDLRLFAPEVLPFPPFGTIPYSGAAPHPSVLGQRMNTLIEASRDRSSIIVTPHRSFITPLPPREFIEEHVMKLRVGDDFDPIALERFLILVGYLRVPQVSVPGEFALRGEVLDVFLPGGEDAVRIVFEFDTIEDLRTFNPGSQASSGKLETVSLFPVSEIIWERERIDGVENLMSAGKASRESIDEILDSLDQRGGCPGEELLFPLTFEDPAGIRDYLPDETLLVVVEPERIHAAQEAEVKETRELYSRSRRQSGRWQPRPTAIYRDYAEVEGMFDRAVIFPSLKEGGLDESRISFSYDGPRSFFGNVVYFREELKSLLDAGYSITIFAESDSQAARIGHLLKDYPIDIVPSGISGGFTLPDFKIVAIQENEIFGRRKRVPVSVHRAQSEAIDTFVELNPGDHVVHVNYGIGRFKGIERITAAGTERDYIELEYQDDETVFIPIEQVNLIQRYIGQEGRAPRLDKIGGKSWTGRKERVKRSVEDLAEMLIELYSKRTKAKGFAFPKDTDWQIEFEAAFPYEETVDQLRCIEEVKADMEKPGPMDRLVCGDVGYGKTEVAMRAAFKAITGGRQVAILAPTTILTEQHFENFVERFQGYPVKIGMISRFVPRSKQKAVLADAEAGRLDLLIGTHRILQKDVKFKELGLLVIDEEQRFGVKDKERIKQLKTSVDCLTLSATPIPRTLHMSLLKIRDMSLLTTPPHNRRPIETFIMEFSEETIAEAVRKEIERGGQVYYLHNRVETLEMVKLFIQRLIPEVMIEIAHGQMDSKDLEDIMHRFIHGGFHVLAATTIIENGIDIPNVNTIIIDRADAYGLSQLYQLRGRVGRSERLAYAYLLYPADHALTEIAMKRLRIISDYTELGSGFKIALKDLEIRGAGNLLGRQQHGDILSVGFDMYVRLLDQAIARMSSDGSPERPEVYLELEYSGYIPEAYIHDPADKMEIYKKIASITTESELNQIFGELQDRFGPLPDQVQSLLSLAEIRIICSKLYVASLKEHGGLAEVEFSRVSAISADKVMRLIRDSGGNVKIDPKRPYVLLMRTEKIGLQEKSEFLREKLSVLL